MRHSRHRNVSSTVLSNHDKWYRLRAPRRSSIFLVSLTSACIYINYLFAVCLGGRKCLSSQMLGINFSCVCAGIYTVYWCLCFVIVISVRLTSISSHETKLRTIILHREQSAQPGACVASPWSYRTLRYSPVKYRLPTANAKRTEPLKVMSNCIKSLQYCILKLDE